MLRTPVNDALYVLGNMNILSSWLRRRAIIRYRKKLPNALSKDYGKSEWYLPQQVKATVERSGLSSSYLIYALALYCSVEDFESYSASNRSELNYDAANEIVDEALFSVSLGRKDTNLSVASPAGESGSILGDSGGDGGGGE